MQIVNSIIVNVTLPCTIYRVCVVFKRVFVSPVLRHAAFHLAVNMCKLNLRFLAAYRGVCDVTRVIL